MLPRFFGILVSAAKALRRSPRFLVLSTLILASGAGANTAIFSLANWALLRPVPGVERAGELVLMSARRAGDSSMVPLSHPIATRLLEPSPAIASGTAWRNQPVDVMQSSGAAAQREHAQVVTAEYFSVLGVRMHLGRGFEPVEDSPVTVHAVVVVGHGYWLEALGGDRDVLGRSLIINGRTFTIIGVAAEGFSGADRTDQVSMWLPSSALPALMPRLPANILAMEQAPIWPSLLLRRTPGASPEDVVSQLMRAEPALETAGIVLDIETRAGLPPGLRDRLQATLIVVGTLVALLLLLTTANLVNLLLSRASRRQQEVAIRRAIGASSARIAGELVGEGVLLALTGAVAAVVTSVFAVRLLGGRSLVLGVPQPGAVPIDARVLGFATLTALAATILASLATAAVLQRIAAADALRARTSTLAGRRFRAGLVSAQIGLSVALVVGAGLAARSLSLIQSRDLGFVPDDVVLFSLNPGVQAYTDAQADAFFRDLVAQLGTDPQVQAAGFLWLPPLSSQRYSERVTGLGVAAGEPIAVDANMITPDLFDALGMELMDGRAFDQREYGRAERPDRGAVILNETLARTLFPDGAVGREIHMEGRRESAFEVIGVVRDARIRSLQEESGPALYDPFGNGYVTTSATFAVRSTATPNALIARIRELVRDRDPQLPVLDPAAMNDMVANALIEERLLTRVTAVFALMSLLLAALGLFGLMSESVQARVHEFGVRAAIGARMRHLFGLVFRDVLIMTGVGALIGLLLSQQLGRLMQAKLFGVEPDNLVVFALAVLTLVVVAVIASAGPAVRAARVDPLEAIRTE